MSKKNKLTRLNLGKHQLKETLLRLPTFASGSRQGAAHAGCAQLSEEQHKVILGSPKLSTKTLLVAKRGLGARGTTRSVL